MLKNPSAEAVKAFEERRAAGRGRGRGRGRAGRAAAAVEEAAKEAVGGGAAIDFYEGLADITDVGFCAVADDRYDDAECEECELALVGAEDEEDSADIAMQWFAVRSREGEFSVQAALDLSGLTLAEGDAVLSFGRDESGARQYAKDRAQEQAQPATPAATRVEPPPRDTPIHPAVKQSDTPRLIPPASFSLVMGSSGAKVSSNAFLPSGEKGASLLPPSANQLAPPPPLDDEDDGGGEKPSATPRQSTRQEAPPLLAAQAKVQRKTELPPTEAKTPEGGTEIQPKSSAEIDKIKELEAMKAELAKYKELAS